MATGAIAIIRLGQELTPAVSEVKNGTREVLNHSRAQTSTFSDIVTIVIRTVRIRSRFLGLIRTQSAMISLLTTLDFTACPIHDMEKLAEIIERAVVNGRGLVKDAFELGSEIRFWWQGRLMKFAEQIEHLDSIAESLRLACDPEASSLLVAAAQHLDPKLH